MISFSAQVRLCRCVIGVIALCAYWSHAALDAWLAVQWHTLRRAWWFQHDSFEPLLATAAFALWVLLFRWLDQCAAPLLVSWRIDRAPPPPYSQFRGHHLLGALAAYLAPLMLYDVLVPRRVLPMRAVRGGELVGGVAAALLVYDFLFYWLHVAFHRIEALRSFHAAHHQQRVMRAAETLRLSFVDGALQVACSIAALHIAGCHPLTRAVYNCTITYLLSEIHSGFDLPFALSNVLPFGVLGGARAHEAHHLHNSGNYQQFFTYLDRLQLFA